MSNDFERRLETAIERLPREREPAVDLWPGIEAGLDGPVRRWTVPASLAAALAAGLALTVWLAAPGPGPEPEKSPSQASATRVSPGAVHQVAYLLREAALVDQSYRAAMLAAPAPARLSGPEQQALAAQLKALDAAQQRIREAMQSQPDGQYLVSLLAQTHALRLDMVQRLAGGPANPGGNDENGNA